MKNRICGLMCTLAFVAGLMSLAPRATFAAETEEGEKPEYCDVALAACILECSVHFGIIEDACEAGCWIGYWNCP